jgi:hypothetical protein
MAISINIFKLDGGPKTMALVKIYGFLDIICALVLVLEHKGLVAWRWPVSFVLYLSIKSIMYLRDVMTWIDLAVAVYMLILLVHGNLAITVIFASYLIIKGIWSLI